MPGTGYQDYNQLEKGDTTYFIYEDICLGDSFDSEASEFTEDDIEAAIDLETKPIFLEGVVKRLHTLGVDCSVNDTEQITSEMKRRYKERIDETCPRTVINWVKGKNTSVNKREQNYTLCYVLEMDLAETAHFFIKHFHSIPFNYKDTTDAIFFYCFRNKRPYSTIRAMLEEASGFQNSKDSPAYTLEIAKQICDIDDDVEFMRYLSKHCYNTAQQYQRARMAIIQLIHARKEGKFAEFHLHVMGFNYQSMTLSKEEKRNFLPKEFIRSLPTDRTFLDIMDGKKPETYETLRKALIILLFYDSYIDPHNSGIEPTEEQIRSRLDDFYDEVNKTLLDCGLVPLYEKNLFDKVILFCANSSFPLDTFHGINNLRYLESQE